MKRLTLIFALVLCAVTSFAKDYKVTSPSGSLTVTVSDGAALTWSVCASGEAVLLPSEIAIRTDVTLFGPGAKVQKATTGKVDKIVPAHFYRKAQIRERYDSLYLKFKGDFDLEVRAYDDAAAVNYPGMFFKKGAGNSLVSEFAPIPLETVVGGYDRLNLVLSEVLITLPCLTGKGRPFPGGPWSWLTTMRSC